MNQLRRVIFTTFLLLLMLPYSARALNKKACVTIPNLETAQQRLLFYNKEALKGKATVNRYADMGELYYGLKKPSLAIFYFEKGLVLSPLHSRLLAGRNKALELCDPSVIANNANFYERKSIITKIIEYSNIVLTVVLLVSSICFFLVKRKQNKVVIQKQCKATALFSIVILLIVYGIYKKEQCQTYGILKRKTSVYNGPNRNAKLTQKWDEGYQIKLVNTYGEWVKVEDYNHQSGWLQQSDLLYLPH